MYRIFFLFVSNENFSYIVVGFVVALFDSFRFDALVVKCLVGEQKSPTHGLGGH